MQDLDASDLFGRGSDVVGDAARSCTGGEPAAVAVGTVYAERKPIAKTADFVGRIEAINRVEIRARVKGYLEAVLFKEGELVQEGQPLLYPVDVMTRKSFWVDDAEIVGDRIAEVQPVPGHCSRRKPSVASANWAHVA